MPPRNWKSYSEWKIKFVAYLVNFILLFFIRHYDVITNFVGRLTGSWSGFCLLSPISSFAFVLRKKNHPINRTILVFTLAFGPFLTGNGAIKRDKSQSASQPADCDSWHRKQNGDHLEWQRETVCSIPRNYRENGNGVRKRMGRSFLFVYGNLSPDGHCCPLTGTPERDLMSMNEIGRWDKRRLQYVSHVLVLRVIRRPAI